MTWDFWNGLVAGLYVASAILAMNEHKWASVARRLSVVVLFTYLAAVSV